MNNIHGEEEIPRWYISGVEMSHQDFFGNCANAPPNVLPHTAECSVSSPISVLKNTILCLRLRFAFNFCDLCLIFVGISWRLGSLGPLSWVNIPHSTFRMRFSNRVSRIIAHFVCVCVFRLCFAFVFCDIHVSGFRWYFRARGGYWPPFLSRHSADRRRMRYSHPRSGPQIAPPADGTKIHLEVFGRMSPSWRRFLEEWIPAGAWQKINISKHHLIFEFFYAKVLDGLTIIWFILSKTSTLSFVPGYHLRPGAKFAVPAADGSLVQKIT